MPELRQSWARRMAELIRPGGLLICLEFPLWKDLNEPGPPWGLKGVHWNLLAEGGDGMNLSSEPSSPLSGNFERIRYIHAHKSHKEGRGTDMLSIWRRKDSPSVA